MNNFVSLVIALLEHAKVLTEAEAQKLVKELHSSTLPGTYEECSRLVKDLFAKHEISTIEKKLKSEVNTVEVDVRKAKAKVVDTLKQL